MSTTASGGAVGIRHLKEHTSQVLRRVREHHETIDVTLRGEVVARLVPVRPLIDKETLERVRAERRRLAEEITKHWPAGVSASAAIAEERD